MSEQTRFTVAFPESEAWVLRALRSRQLARQQDGPTPSLGSLVREILAKEFEQSRPPSRKELELQAMRDNGYDFNKLPL